MARRLDALQDGTNLAGYLVGRVLWCGPRE